MEQWVIFGYGNYLSDIFDTITTSGGRIRAVINNISPTDEQRSNLKRRLDKVGYSIPVIDIRDFSPSEGEKYCMGVSAQREELYMNVQKTHDIGYSALVHPRAYVSSGVRIGEGVTIGPLAVIGPNAVLGNFSLVSRGASVGHDTVIGEFSIINPSAAIAGCVHIGAGSTIGIGSTIIDHITIGKHSFVGAGAAVVKDVPDNVVVVGVPAKILRKNE